MKLFLKINGMSLLYAIAVFVPIELIVNTNRLTGREFPLELLILLDVIVATLLFYHLSKKWLDDRKSSYWSALLWLPYFLMIIFASSLLIQSTSPVDNPGPGAGLVIIGILMMYPFYIMLVTFIGLGNKES